MKITNILPFCFAIYGVLVSIAYFIPSSAFYNDGKSLFIAGIFATIGTIILVMDKQNENRTII